jgi:hypothetical protein
MSTHKVGDWMAITGDGGTVFTGLVTGVEHTADGTRYAVDVLADDQPRPAGPRRRLAFASRE